MFPTVSLKPFRSKSPVLGMTTVVRPTSYTSRCGIWSLARSLTVLVPVTSLSSPTYKLPPMALTPAVLFNSRVPWRTRVSPRKTLAWVPDSSRVPSPTLINRFVALSALAMTPLMLSRPPESTPMRLLPPARSMFPAHVLVATPILRKAPSPPSPRSARVESPKPTPPSRIASASVIVSGPLMLPSRCRAAPAWICVSPVVESPRALLWAATRTP